MQMMTQLKEHKKYGFLIMLLFNNGHTLFTTNKRKDKS
jgi:hypothetical protein